MKLGDIVSCKTLVKPTGVMGSSLKEYKHFDGLAMVVGKKKKNTIIMKYDGKIISIKTSFLKIVIE